MDNKIIEELRKIHEIEYRQIDSSAIVVVEFGEIDYETNDTIKMYKSKGYKLFDSNRFGEGLHQCGKFLVFVRK
jgi:hypothetical protein